MAADKEKLKSDLKKWMNDGKEGKFSSSIEGLDVFADCLKDYASEASDAFGNKMIAFTAAELKASLSALVNSETTSAAATAFSSGISASFVGKILQFTSSPGVGVSNTISKPVLPSDIKSDIEDILNANYEGIEEEVLITKLSSDWADVLEKALKSNNTTLNYLVGGITPASIEGSLS